VKASYHNFKPKPTGTGAFVKHADRAKQVNSARTRWRKKLIAGIAEQTFNTQRDTPHPTPRKSGPSPVAPKDITPGNKPKQQGRVNTGRPPAMREEIIQRILEMTGVGSVGSVSMPLATQRSPEPVLKKKAPPIPYTAPRRPTPKKIPY
jgi:hypothetical protein